MTPLPWSLLGHRGTSWWSHLLACGAGFPKSFQEVHSGGSSPSLPGDLTIQVSSARAWVVSPHTPSCEPTFRAAPDDGKGEGVVGIP